MKYLITIPASLTHGKKPKIVPAKVFIIEAFTAEQAERRMSNSSQLTGSELNVAKVEPLNDWLEAIPTI